MIRQFAVLIDGFEEEGDFNLDMDIHTYREITSDDEPLFLKEKNLHSLYSLMDGTRYQYFKTQQTAPATMGFSIRGTDGKQLVSRNMFHFFESLMRRIALGQYNHLSEHCDTIIICQDDPGLGFVKQMIETKHITDMSFEQIVKMTDGIYPNYVIPAYHYCDDWRVLEQEGWYPLWESKVKIVHIDVVRYPAKIDSEQSEKINEFLVKGGGLALGILPNTDDAFEKPVLETLKDNLLSTLTDFHKCGVDLELLENNTMISTQCGLSGASPELTKEIHERSMDFKDIYLKQFELLLR
ncbi:hypothetical protein EU527_09580 [Candidatus Thorarchaeota archaeon]|nr:MAG: hypothetical protein EU527_09580 [Candidatus Thorarchaeota archaeon]